VPDTRPVPWTTRRERAVSSTREDTMDRRDVDQRGSRQCSGFGDLHRLAVDRRLDVTSSITSTSQSEISMPLSLMLTPTESRLPDAFSVCEAMG